MGRAKETFGKKEVRNKQLKKRKEKEKRKLERKEQGKSSFEDMIAWVDENGQILSEPPSLDDKEEIKAENIEVSVPKSTVKTKDTLFTGRIRNFDESKGFGFIGSQHFQESVFFHITNCEQEVRVGDDVEFETEKGLKGLKAIHVKRLE